MKRYMRKFLYLIVLLSCSWAQAGAYEDFLRAVVRDDGGTIRELVARGVDPNSPDERGQPAIIKALFADSNQAALTLAGLPGTDVNVRNPAGETPLMIAALKGQLAVADALIRRGAALEPGGWTPLHYAAAGDSLPLVQRLLQQGAAIDARAPNGRTPLMMAAVHGSEELVDALLAAGADVRAVERYERTAVELARATGREHMVRHLTARGAR